jgi:hypothetical protein
MKIGAIIFNACGVSGFEEMLFVETRATHP